MRPQEMDDILLVPSLEEVKRNLGHLARTGRLPHINYRRPWLGAGKCALNCLTLLIMWWGAFNTTPYDM